jgi:uncharacterized protein (TIGR00290 family)
LTARHRPKALIAWSSGKDSAFALHEIRKADDFDIVGALTTVRDDTGRVTVHGVREELLRAQLDAAGLPPLMVRIPDPCPDDAYAREMAAALARARSAGVTHVVFGDLFLGDLRAWREARLSEVGMAALFPLWQRPTRDLAREMMDAGVKAHLTTVDLSTLAPSFAGRAFDAELLSELPAEVDPCGENGEFHTFVTAGPMFRCAIPVAVGETISRDGFAYADLRAA